MEIPSEAEDFVTGLYLGCSGLVESCWSCLIYVLAFFYAVFLLWRAPRAKVTFMESKRTNSAFVFT